MELMPATENYFIPGVTTINKLMVCMQGIQLHLNFTKNSRIYFNKLFSVEKKIKNDKT